MKALTPLLTCTLAAATLPASGAGEARPFPQHIVYTAGTLLPTAGDRDQATVAFYRAWKATYLRSTGDGQRYVFCNAEGTFDPKSTRSVSEGHGYGMLAAVLMAGADPEARADFDGMFRYYRAHPSDTSPALMAWRQVAKGAALVSREGDRDSATDGDLDIACALLMADRQWGSNGPVAYRREAQSLLAAIQASEIDPKHHTPTLGSWVDDESPQRSGLRPSDFMPAHWKTFADATRHSQAAQKWTRCTDATYRVLGEVQTAFSPRTGLQPDFIAWKNGSYRPAPSGFLEGPNDGAYGYNACRVPWRVGTDYLLTGDPRALALLRPLNAWVVQATGGDPGKLNAGYRLDGTPLKADSSAAFVGPLAVAAMTDPARQAWLDALWNNLVARGPGTEDYYGNTVKLLTMIVISGNWWQ